MPQPSTFPIFAPMIDRRYHNYLLLERSLSKKTIEAYESDLEQLLLFLQQRGVVPEKATLDDLQEFVYQQSKLNKTPRTQARMISGIKSYYKYLLFSDDIQTDPTELLEMPKLGEHLPEVLTLEEIDRMITAIDLSKVEGQRNRAIIEVLYGSGLRVSELVNLKFSNIYWQEGYMLVEGKGSKQRLVPLSDVAQQQLGYWRIDRNALNIKPGNEDFVFLNRRGGQLTRAMIFKIVQDLATAADIKKTVSPHTLRHSFATHLLQNGANLLVIQKLLGHESITTTEIYTHMDMRYLREEILKYHPHNRQKNE